MKRQIDLRVLASAIQRYKDEHGEFPSFIGDNSAYSFSHGSVSRLQPVLLPYIKEIPSDPNKHFSVYGLHARCAKKRRVEGDAHCRSYFPQGQYFYQIYYQTNEPKALLAAKVETPEFANHISQEDQ